MESREVREDLSKDEEKEEEKEEKAPERQKLSKMRSFGGFSALHRRMKNLADSFSHDSRMEPLSESREMSEASTPEELYFNEKWFLEEKSPMEEEARLLPSSFQEKMKSCSEKSEFRTGVHRRIKVAEIRALSFSR